jgi:ATP-binding cassette subfamily C protein CydCD
LDLLNWQAFDRTVNALAAPLAGLLHWLESWLAHDIAYRLLAEMRIDLFRKLDTLAPAYLVRRRSGDLVALANQDVETIEYFFAHTVTPALVAILVPSAVLATLAIVAWPIALALLPFVLCAVSPRCWRERGSIASGAQATPLGLLGTYMPRRSRPQRSSPFRQYAGQRRGFMDSFRLSSGSASICSTICRHRPPGSRLRPGSAARWR